MIRYFYTAKYIDTLREEFRNLLDCARSGSVGSDIEICKAILFNAYIDIVADKYNVVLFTTLATQKLWEVPELEVCWRSPVFVQAVTHVWEDTTVSDTQLSTVITNVTVWKEHFHSMESTPECDKFIWSLLKAWGSLANEVSQAGLKDRLFEANSYLDFGWNKRILICTTTVGLERATDNVRRYTKMQILETRPRRHWKLVYCNRTIMYKASSMAQRCRAVSYLFPFTFLLPPFRPSCLAFTALALSAPLVLWYCSTLFCTLPISCFGFRMYVNLALLALFWALCTTSIPSTFGL